MQRNCGLLIHPSEGVQQNALRCSAIAKLVIVSQIADFGAAMTGACCFAFSDRLFPVIEQPFIQVRNGSGCRQQRGLHLDDHIVEGHEHAPFRVFLDQAMLTQALHVGMYV